MIKVSNLVKVFTGRGQPVRAVDDASTEIARGEVVVKFCVVPGGMPPSQLEISRKFSQSKLW